jgi:hypothetical protein
VANVTTTPTVTVRSEGCTRNFTITDIVVLDGAGDATSFDFETWVGADAADLAGVTGATVAATATVAVVDGELVVTGRGGSNGGVAITLADLGLADGYSIVVHVSLDVAQVLPSVTRVWVGDGDASYVSAADDNSTNAGAETGVLVLEIESGTWTTILVRGNDTSNFIITNVTVTPGV